MAHAVKVGKIVIGRGRPLALIAGPCVIEGRRQCLRIAARLKALATLLPMRKTIAATIAGIMIRVTVNPDE